MTEFFILAGGYGKRALPLSRYLPKPMFPLNGTPLIKLMLSQLQQLGLLKGYINLHHLGEKIVKSVSSRDVEFIFEKELSGSAVLKTVADSSGEMILAVNGDILLNIPFPAMERKLVDSGAEGVLLVRRNDGDYSSLMCKGDIFEGVSEEREQGMFMYTGVALFRKRLLSEFGDVSFFKTLERIDADIRTVEYNGPWLDTGTPELYYSSDLTFRKIYKIGGVNSIGENVHILPGAVVENSILWNGTFVEKGVEMRRCIVVEDVIVKPGLYDGKIITKEEISALKI